jgi:hypothetical protein
MRPVSLFWVTVLSIAVLGAVWSADAQANEAPEWLVNELPLALSKTAEFSAKNTSAITLNATGLGIELSAPTGDCSIFGQLKGTEAEAADVTESTILSCTGVTLPTAANCSVHSGSEASGVVKTNTLKGTLVWLEKTTSAAGVLLKPASGTELAKITIEKKEGKTCAISGTYVVAKEVIAKFLPVEKEAETAELNFPSTAVLKDWSNAGPRVEQKIEQLTFGGKAATLAGSFSMNLQAGGKVGVDGKGPTKLCKVAVPPNCAAANVIVPAPKQEIEATDESPAQPKILLTMVTLMPPASFGISCLKSKLTAETVEREAEPLAVKNIGVEFNQCETQLANACTVTMTNKPVNGVLVASQTNPGHGALGMAMTVSLVCGGSPAINCVYASELFPLTVFGANVATIKPSSTVTLAKQPFGLEAGCLNLLGWSATYSVAKPQPVWVSR